MKLLDWSRYDNKYELSTDASVVPLSKCVQRECACCHAIDGPSEHIGCKFMPFSQIFFDVVGGDWFSLPPHVLFVGLLDLCVGDLSDNLVHIVLMEDEESFCEVVTTQTNSFVLFTEVEPSFQIAIGFDKVRYLDVDSSQYLQFGFNMIAVICLRCLFR